MIKYLPSTRSLLPACLAVLVASGVQARTWRIQPGGMGDAPTVQAGIDSAAVGDTVLVHPGTYSEAIDFLGKDIVVKSSAGPAGTILDGSGADYVVSFHGGESRLSAIEGLTISNGHSGILIFNSQPSVRGNVISWNQGNFTGAGITADGEPYFSVPTFRPLIQGNTITHNTATRIGGGIGTWQRMAPEILDNVITDNEATDGDGGGIYLRGLDGDDGSIIRGNIIDNNRAGDHGGGIYVWHVGDVGIIEAEVSWNLISNNVANGVELTGNSGGGLFMWETDAWVHHNTIVANTGNGPTSIYGGGIVLERPGSPVVEKNIIALTRAGGGIWCGGGATPTIQNNLAWQNAGGDGVGDCSTWWQSNGNIVADPAFCDTLSADFHLAQNSPAITHYAGPLGVYPIPGCGPVAVQRTTWGALKSKYRADQ